MKTISIIHGSIVVFIGIMSSWFLDQIKNHDIHPVVLTIALITLYNVGKSIGKFEALDEQSTDNTPKSFKEK